MTARQKTKITLQSREIAEIKTLGLVTTDGFTEIT